ncbi:MAG TPA: NAD(P)/FAD-dependent oxidoreductase [Thermoanaerobaculia bacterium]|nr:NAD(P)/FAD-dependent oxidoreductase [Thermoanaerobaculia bacterium]
MAGAERAEDADLVIVGAGPAGLATAIFAAQRGLRPVVLEGSRPPLDKACGEGVLPQGVALLDELGIRFEARASAAFLGIRFLDDRAAAEADFPGPPGLAVRRIHLSEALIHRAGQMGVDLRFGTGARRLAAEGVETAHGLVRGLWVVGADGLHSRVRRWAGLAAPPGPYRRFGVRRHYALRPWAQHVEVHWTAGCEAYVTPAGSDCVGVAMLWSGGKGSFDDHLARFPELRERLSGAPAASPDRGAGPLHQRAQSAVRGRVALVGDAAGYLDALTGEGIALGLREARALAEAAAAGDLQPYRRAQRRLARLPELLTRLLLAAERRPRLRRRLIGALAQDRSLFTRLLGVHSGALPPRGLGLPGALRLASLWLGGRA